MQELETLLNHLITLGWKPWGKIEANDCTVEHQKQVCVWSKHYRMLRKGSLRELVSLESGLWKFVCSQKLLSDKVDMSDYREDSYGFRSCPFDSDGEYRMMRSSLLPEEELAQFLVDNIKVEGSSKSEIR